MCNRRREVKNVVWRITWRETGIEIFGHTAVTAPGGSMRIHIRLKFFLGDMSSCTEPSVFTRAKASWLKFFTEMTRILCKFAFRYWRYENFLHQYKTPSGVSLEL